MRKNILNKKYNFQKQKVIIPKEGKDNLGNNKNDYGIKK